MVDCMQATFNIPPGHLAGALNTVFLLPSGFASASTICTLIYTTRHKLFVGKTPYASLTASSFILGCHPSEGTENRTFG